MKVVKTQKDDLNAVLTLTLDHGDFQPKVDEVLTNYRKKANIPGFRKGQVPMGLVKKQYGMAVLVEEVNKLLQQEMGRYLQEEKLALLGNPLPVDKPIDWQAEQLSFDFEVGLSPEFNLDLKTKKAITHYQIVADKKMLDDQIDRIQKQFGTVAAVEQSSKTAEIKGTFTLESAEINNQTTLLFDQLKSKKAQTAFLGAKVGDVLTFETKGLFEEDFVYARAFGKKSEEVKDLDAAISFEVISIEERTPAALDQELFDKLYGPGVVDSEKALREKIKAEAEEQFNQQADQKLYQDVTDALLDATSFNLPAAFFTKWLMTSGEKPMNEQEAAEAYAQSEKALRFQLIEGKIIEQNNLQVKFEELKDFAKKYIAQQMAQYGQMNPKDEELESIAARILSNQDEVKRLSDQLMSEKLVALFKEACHLKAKEVTYDKFIAEAYSA